MKRFTGRQKEARKVAADVATAGFWPLDITFEHGVAAARLPPHTNDPFGRMLAAQARVEGLTLVTRERRLRQYVPVLWD